MCNIVTENCPQCGVRADKTLAANSAPSFYEAYLFSRFSMN